MSDEQRPVSAAAHEGALFCRDLLAGLLETEERPDVAGRLRKKIAQCDAFAALPHVPNLWKDCIPDTPTPEQLRFALALSRPPWWRFVARRRWRKRYEEAMKRSSEETK